MGARSSPVAAVNDAGRRKGYRWRGDARHIALTWIGVRSTEIWSCGQTGKHMFTLSLAAFEPK
jgi:hypothetical protein